LRLIAARKARGSLVHGFMGFASSPVRASTAAVVKATRSIHFIPILRSSESDGWPPGEPAEGASSNRCEENGTASIKLHRDEGAAHRCKKMR